jgi:hypothetical protein
MKSTTDYVVESRSLGSEFKGNGPILPEAEHIALIPRHFFEMLLIEKNIFLKEDEW